MVASKISGSAGVQTPPAPQVPGGGTECHDVRLVPRAPRAVRWYVAGSLAASAVHPVLPAAVRPSSYFLIALGAVIPMGLGVRGTPKGDRRPGYLLLAALLVLSVKATHDIDPGRPFMIMTVAVAAAVGFFAGLLSFKVKLRWCRVCGAALNCPYCTGAGGHRLTTRTR